MGSDGFTLLGARRLGRGAFLTIDRAYYLVPTGGWAVREVVAHPGAAAVVPWDGSRVHLVRQFRPALGQSLLEIPAGKLDVAGEAPAAAARRECQEEVGLLPGRLTLLQAVFTSPGFTDELIHVYLAEDLEAVPLSPQGPEEHAAQVVALTLDEVAALVEGGECRDAKTLLALQAFLRRMGR